jgi:hypothetical protein
MAQKALKCNDDMTFSPDEIDMLLPIGLRKNKGLKGPSSAKPSVPSSPSVATSSYLMTCSVLLLNAFGPKRGSPRLVALQTCHADFCMQRSNTNSASPSPVSRIERRCGASRR